MLKHRIKANYSDYTTINNDVSFQIHLMSNNDVSFRVHLMSNNYRDGEGMPLLAKKRPPKEMTLLMNEINRTKIALEAAYSNFENVVDPDLIDSCIYELNAIQNRYHFLLKQAKAFEKITVN